MTKKPRAAGRQKVRSEAATPTPSDPAGSASSTPAAELLHELQVHQLELELQNEELRRAQLELGASRDRYLDLYDFAPVGYFTVSDAGLIQEANLTCATLLGVDRRKLWGTPLTSFVAPGSLGGWRNLLSDLRRSPERRSCDLLLRRSDGSVFTGQLECQRLNDGDAAPTVRVALADVTAHRKAEADLRLRESLLTAILDGTADGILVVGSGGKVLRANRHFQELWRVPDDLLAAGEDQALLAFVSGQLADPAGFAGEVERLYRSSGDSIDKVALADGRVFERRSSPFHFDGPGGRLWSFRDVTEQRRGEEALRRSEAKFRGLFDTMMDGLVVVDMAGTITESNDVYQRMLGYTPEELGRLTYRQLTPAPWHAMEERIVAEQVLRRGYSEVYEKEYRRKDGSVFPVELRTFLLREAGQPSAMWAIVRDVSERTAAAENLRSVEKQLAIAARLAAMGTLVAGMAHEINNPLSVELGNGALALEAVRQLLGRLRGGGALDRSEAIAQLEEVIAELEEAQAGGLRIQQIVKDLATIGRPEARRRRARVSSVVDAAIRWLPPGVARSAEIRVERGPTPDILAAPGQVEQVLVNLVTNAVKSTPDRHPAPVLIRTGAGAGGTARLEVIDQGAGIDPAIRDRIFEPFFTTREVGHGTGLGLSVSHAIVVAHGGTITVETTVGQGSTFRIELPAAAEGD